MAGTFYVPWLLALTRIKLPTSTAPCFGPPPTLMVQFTFVKAKGFLLN